VGVGDSTPLLRAAAAIGVIRPRSLWLANDLKTAKAIGLTIPQQPLQPADKVIE
jgi:hypothetical protein